MICDPCIVEAELEDEFEVIIKECGVDDSGNGAETDPIFIAWLATQGLTSFKKINLVSGNVDGINKVFIWEHVPLQIFWNGQKLTINRSINGYTLVGMATTLTETPQPISPGNPDGDSVESYGNY